MPWYPRLHHTALPRIERCPGFRAEAPTIRFLLHCQVPPGWWKEPGYPLFRIWRLPPWPVRGIDTKAGLFPGHLFLLVSPDTGQSKEKKKKEEKEDQKNYSNCTQQCPIHWQEGLTRLTPHARTKIEIQDIFMWECVTHKCGLGRQSPMISCS